MDMNTPEVLYCCDLGHHQRKPCRWFPVDLEVDWYKQQTQEKLGKKILWKDFLKKKGIMAISVSRSKIRNKVYALMKVTQKRISGGLFVSDWCRCKAGSLWNFKDKTSGKLNAAWSILQKLKFLQIPEWRTQQFGFKGALHAFKSIDGRKNFWGQKQWCTRDYPRPIWF